MVRQPELRFREYDRYRAFYCGLCHAIGRRCAAPARLALSFEMTFLSMLLTSLYEDETAEVARRCILHPVRSRRALSGKMIDYGADMAILTAWYDLRDGWEDERRPDMLAAEKLLSAARNAVGEVYPRQDRAVRDYVSALHAAEKRGDPNLDAASNLAGAMLAELYAVHEDCYAQDLRTLGFAVGKYIALCDSYEDIERDHRKNSYNPLLPLADRADFAGECETMLQACLAPGAAAFERLPVLEDAEILRNILYSGIWQRFERATQKRKAKSER